MAGKKKHKFTLGIEEEFQIVDPVTRELKSHIEEIIEGGKVILKERVRAELHQSVVEVGTEVTVEVLDVDMDRERVSLSLKATQEDPWQHFARTHQIGQVAPGRVTKLVPFGAFVRVEEGIEGLVHISELADHHVENPREVVNQGDELEVRIIEIDADRRRNSACLSNDKHQLRQPLRVSRFQGVKLFFTHMQLAGQGLNAQSALLACFSKAPPQHSQGMIGTGTASCHRAFVPSTGRGGLTGIHGESAGSLPSLCLEISVDPVSC